MRIVKLSELNEKERKEYDRQRRVREQNAVLEREKEKERVRNLMDNTNDSYSNNVLPKANKFNISITEPITNKEKYEANTIVKSSQAFKDGYQVGDVSKTVGSTLANVGTNLWQGVHNTGVGIGKALAGGVAQVADFVGQDEYADRVRKNMTEETPFDKLVRESNEATSKNSVLGQKAGNVIQGIGNVGGTLAAQAVGVPWQVTAGLSSVGSGLSEAYSEGATDAEAWLSAGLGAGAEIGSEYLFGGIKLPGTGKVTEEIIGELTDKIKNNAVKQLTKFGINAVGEGAEEVISGLGNALGKKLTYMSEKELSELYSSEDALNDFVTGTITSAIVGGGQQIHQNSVANQNAQQKIREAQNIINNVSKDNIANNTQTMYNNSNESESGINGNIERHIVEGRNGIYEKQERKLDREYTWEEYNKWEQSIKTIRTEEYTESERKSIKYANSEYNKTVALYNEEENDNTYSGGASKNIKGRITISRQKAELYGLDRMIAHENVESDILHNEQANDILTPVVDIIIKDKKFQNQKDKFWENQIDKIPSDRTIAKDIICDRFSEIRLKVELDYENVLSNATNLTIDMALSNYFNQIYGKDINETDSVSSTDNSMSHFGLVSVSNNIRPQNNSNMQAQQEVEARRKTLNPTEIANLKLEDANTTPELPNRNYEKGNKQSNFYENITETSQFLNEDVRNLMKDDENIKYYKGVTNEETLNKAYEDLQNGGQEETNKWFAKDDKEINAEDVAKGWILLKQYQDKGDYESAVQVAKKMRDMGTKAGQAVQAYNILSRLTPEGMFYYVQSELSEAYNKMVEGKSKKWIEENQSKFNLNPDETQFIMDTMKEVTNMEEGYEKKAKIAEIQKVISDKIPATASQSVKAWMRISMLFNAKTQVRNVSGNAVIVPVNAVSDAISSRIDKAIAKKTGVRTTGTLNLDNYVDGFKKGLFESYNDFKNGINTRNIEGNRFEVSEGKNFNDKGIGKALNRVDNMLSFVLDAGDRGFYEATFTNSINNQLILNNTTEVTSDMIDIATREALQRTWQDNNAYTRLVLGLRKGLNFGKGYGLGDILIPFAKTPANLTKAIIDYSPVGLTKTLAVDARKLKNSLENGQYTPQLQHQFVQNLGKGMAGSLLYVLGYALAKAGIASGEADDDKDVKNFMKNSLGISSYSIKIGDKTFTYDWAQPIATPLAIMTNYVKYSKDNPDANALERIWKSMTIGTEQLLEQSFMESLNTVLNGSGSTLENLSQAVLELPARAIPTLSKQVADMVDGTQRTSFEYGKPIQSAANSVIAKIPFASMTLPTARDTLGNEIKKYGGENNIFNVMLNPANTNKGELSKAGEEIYNVYMQTGDTTIFPRTAPYYINSKGNKITMTSTERSKFQEVSGKYVENTMNGLLNDKEYQKLSNEKKASIINEIVSDSYSKAKYDVLKIDTEEYKKLRNTLKDVSTTSYYDYKFKTEDMKKDKEKLEVVINANYTDKEKTELYENYIKSKDDAKYDIIKTTGLNINSYLKYKLAEGNDKFKSETKDDGTVDGKPVSGSAKAKKYSYISSMKGISYTQRLILWALEYEPSSNSEKKAVLNYVTSLEGKTNEEKLDILSNFKGVKIYKDGTIKY